MSKSNLLIDETPIVFQPSLAKLIGLHEAIVLQTLRFWCGQKKCGKVVDDERWIFNTAEQWREFSFPFWSARTIGEIFRTLEAMGLVKSKQFDLKAGKAMKYYTISQSALSILTSERADQLEDSSTPIWNILPDHLEDSSRSARARLIKQYTEKQTEKQKPLTPLQGEVENSAEASSSTSDDLFPNNSQTDSAMIAERSSMDSRPKAAIPNKLATFQTRANVLLGRRPATKWAANEIKAAANWLDTTDEEWELLEGYYANRGQDGYFCRKSMLTLLNNWSSEIDKARSNQPVKPKQTCPDEKEDPEGFNAFWASVKPND
jgi:hypothetical protein